MSDELVQRIIDLRERHNWTQKDLADRLGFGKVTMNKIENGNRKVTNEELLKIANIFDVSTDYLLGKSVNPTNAIPYDRASVVSIPVIGTIKCGPDGLAMYDNNGYESVDKDDLENGEEYFWLITSGDSMIGDHIQAGDYALIKKTQAFENGDICAVVVDGEEGTLKHVNKGDNMITLSASNPDYPPRVFVGEKMNEVYIAGKLVEIKHKF